VPGVKAHGVRAQKPFHSFDQIGPRRLHHQVKMIAHQTVGMHLPACLSTHCFERLQEPFPVQIVTKNFFAPIPPGSSGDKWRPHIEYAIAAPSPTPDANRHLCQ
jgi:hypothetical protein